MRIRKMLIKLWNCQILQMNDKLIMTSFCITIIKSNITYFQNFHLLKFYLKQCYSDYKFNTINLFKNYPPYNNYLYYARYQISVFFYTHFSISSSLHVHVAILLFYACRGALYSS